MASWLSSVDKPDNDGCGLDGLSGVDSHQTVGTVSDPKQIFNTKRFVIISMRKVKELECYGGDEM